MTIGTKHNGSGLFRAKIAGSACILGGVWLVASCALEPSRDQDSSGGTAGTAAAGTGGSAGTGTAGGGGRGGGTAGSASGGRDSPAGAGGASTSGRGGQAGTSAGTGQGGSAGKAGGAGAGGIAGSASGGASSGTSGSGGSAGSAGGAGGGTGGSGGKAAPEPSEGCDKDAPPLGSSGSPLMVSGHQYYVKLPAGYDASKPYPVLFMFNPTGNPINWAEQNAGFESNEAKDAWIRVYPHPANSSSGWGSGDVAFFEPLYTTITGNFCVDKARVFAAGESSGGDFASILGCEHADKLRGIGPCATKPVGGYPLDASSRDCTGRVTAVVIHGKMDNVVGPENGPLTRDFYVELNACTDMSMPVNGFTDTRSNCVEYQGCADGFPVVWCQHTDPNYSNTNHGWPAFAANYLFEKFSSY